MILMKGSWLINIMILIKGRGLINQGSTTSSQPFLRRFRDIFKGCRELGTRSHGA